MAWRLLGGALFFYGRHFDLGLQSGGGQPSSTSLRLLYTGEYVLGDVVTIILFREGRDDGLWASLPPSLPLPSPSSTSLPLTPHISLYG